MRQHTHQNTVHAQVPANDSSHLPKKALLATLVTALLAPTGSYAAESIAEAFKEGKTQVSFRLRYEDVNDDATGKDDAQALTLKSRLTYATAEFQNFSLLLEADNVTELDDVDYNDLTNGKTDKTVIADPENTEVNQSYLAFSGIPDTHIKFGRQRILLDNQRFVGGVGFRQNEQTYDALTVTNSSLPDTHIFFGYINEVIGITGDDSKHETTLFSVKYSGLPIGSISAYAYDFEEDESGGYDIETYGLRFSGANALSNSKLLYTAEYASQDQNNGSKPDYYLLEGGLSFSGITAKLGLEVLESDDGAGFSTPLATKHKFQGWTDQFLGTPADGIEDRYLSLGTKVAGVKLLAVYHDYEAESSSDELGEEFGFVVAKQFNDNYGLSLKYSDYNASSESGKDDKSKLWLTATAKF